MKNASEQPPEGGLSRLTLATLGLWAAAALAYPLWFLVRILRDSEALATALVALPSVVVHSFAHVGTLAAATAMWAVAIGAGAALLRRAGFSGLNDCERAVFGGAVGMGILSLGTFLAGSLGGTPQWLMTALCYLLLAAMAAFASRELVRLVRAGGRGLRDWRREASRAEVALVVLAAIGVAIALAKANVPVFLDYDSLEYHLAAPAQWWREGRVTFIRDVVYTNFPQNVEMLCLLAMCCFGGPLTGAAVGLQVGVGFVVLTAFGIAAAGRRFESRAAGRLGALIFLSTPMLAELATLNSYVVELPLAAYSFLSLFAFLLYRKADRPAERWRMVVLSGLMAGLGLGCKYPAALFLLAPLGAFFLVGGILDVSRAWEAVRAFGLAIGVALVVAGPWFARNAINTGNPVYPLLYRVFDGRNWSAEQDVRFRIAHEPREARFVGLGPRFLRFAFWRDQPQRAYAPPASAVLFLFALVPIALADRRSSAAVFYLATVFVAFGSLERFFPPAEIGAGLPAAVLCGCAVVGLACSTLERPFSNPVFHLGWMFLAAGGLLWASRSNVLSPGAIGQLLTATIVLAVVASPAFLVHRAELVFPAVHFVLWLMSWYFLTHRLDRFLDPATPLMALVGGVGAAALPGPRLRAAVGGAIGFALGYMVLIGYVLWAPLMWFGLSEPPGRFLREATAGTTYCHQIVERINQLPEDSTVLFLGEARTLYCRRRVLASSVFDRGPLERVLADGRGEPGKRVRDGLRKLGVTHLYVNWQELGRLASTYSYRYRGRQRQGVPLDLYRRLLERMERRGFIAPVAAYGPEIDGRRREDFVLYRLN